METKNVVAKVETSDLERIEKACTGKYRTVLREFASDIQRYFGLTIEQRLRAISSLSSDLGRLQVSEAGIRLGKLNKDGMLSVREVAKAVKSHLTPSLALLKACDLITEISVYHVKVSGNEITFTTSIQEWIDKV